MVSRTISYSVAREPGAAEAGASWGRAVSRRNASPMSAAVSSPASRPSGRTTGQRADAPLAQLPLCRGDRLLRPRHRELAAHHPTDGRRRLVAQSAQQVVQRQQTDDALVPVDDGEVGLGGAQRQLDRAAQGIGGGQDLRLPDHRLADRRPAEDVVDRDLLPLGRGAEPDEDRDHDQEEVAGREPGEPEEERQPLPDGDGDPRRPPVVRPQRQQRPQDAARRPGGRPGWR